MRRNRYGQFDCYPCPTCGEARRNLTVVSYLPSSTYPNIMKCPTCGQTWKVSYDEEGG
jgi:uncharacterized Zn finger protein